MTCPLLTLSGTGELDNVLSSIITHAGIGRPLFVVEWTVDCLAARLNEDLSLAADYSGVAADSRGGSG